MVDASVESKNGRINLAANLSGLYFFPIDSGLTQLSNWNTLSSVAGTGDAGILYSLPPGGEQQTLFATWFLGQPLQKELTTEPRLCTRIVSAVRVPGLMKALVSLANAFFFALVQRC